ncbi:hypothetical protein DJ527_08020 [Sulfolobus sp. F1]|nr:hypothetical protein DJ527_08020 [Sulfolobus sp. F1]
MRIIERVKLDKIESCGSKSPVSIMMDAIRKIKECEEGVEILLNDYDWLLTLKYLLKMSDMQMKIEEKGRDGDFVKVNVFKDC